VGKGGPTPRRRRVSNSLAKKKAATMGDVGRAEKLEMNVQNV